MLFSVCSLIDSATLLFESTLKKCRPLGRRKKWVKMFIYGQTKKCLILDLDNTLWGGVIGDDGVNGIQLGLETPTGEAFYGFQTYLKGLRAQGVILAVCTKNELKNAKSGFSHPDSVLQLEDFTVFKANWKSKPENICDIAEALNLGLDSLVFFDDNPAERALVASQLPEVSVPELGDADVTEYIAILEKTLYFEPTSLSEDCRASQHAYSAVVCSPMEVLDVQKRIAAAGYTSSSAIVAPESRSYAFGCQLLKVVLLRITRIAKSILLRKLHSCNQREILPT